MLQGKKIIIKQKLPESVFLKVKAGDAVLYKKDQIGKVLTFIGGSRDPDAPSLFQIANVDSGEIRGIHDEEVTEIVSKYQRNTMLT